MPNIEVINEMPLTMAEMKEHLQVIEKRDKELNARAKKVKTYLDHFTKVKKDKINEIKKQLETLNITRLKDRHIEKIIDLLPEDLTSMRAIFTGENVTLKQEDLQKILDIVKKA